MTSVRLSDEIEKRVLDCATTLGRSKHAVMVAAIERGLPDVEREAEDWKRFKATREPKPTKSKR